MWFLRLSINALREPPRLPAHRSLHAALMGRRRRNRRGPHLVHRHNSIVKRVPGAPVGSADVVPQHQQRFHLRSDVNAHSRSRNPFPLWVAIPCTDDRLFFVAAVEGILGVLSQTYCGGLPARILGRSDRCSLREKEFVHHHRTQDPRISLGGSAPQQIAQCRSMRPACGTSMLQKQDDRACRRWSWMSV